MGMDVRMVAPKELQTSPEVVAQAEKLAKDSGARILITDDTAQGGQSWKAGRQWRNFTSGLPVASTSWVLTW